LPDNKRRNDLDRKRKLEESKRKESDRNKKPDKKHWSKHKPKEIKKINKLFNKEKSGIMPFKTN